MESDDGLYGIKWFKVNDEDNIGVCGFSNKLAFITSTPLPILYEICDTVEISEEEGDLVCEVGSGCYCDSCPYCNISFEDMVKNHSSKKLPDDFPSELRKSINRWEKRLHNYEKENGELKPGVYVSEE